MIGIEERRPVSNNQHVYYNGSLYNLLRQIASINLETEQIVEAMQEPTTAPQASGSDPYAQYAAASQNYESSAAVVPVTVMFADLRNFTALVEEYPPNQVIRQLNEYFSCMTRIIVEHGGVLDKYMGDEIMAYFESQNPLEYSKAASQAVLSGIKMIEALKFLNQRWSQRGWPTLKSGIGLNSGPVLKGNVGSMVKLETTIIGDTVNVASRLQQLNKAHDTCFLISANTYKLVQGSFPVRSLGDISIRGRSKSVNVYEIDFQALSAMTPTEDNEAAI
jgi:class 3 adenylate cyclase